MARFILLCYPKSPIFEPRQKELKNSRLKSFLCKLFELSCPWWQLRYFYPYENANKKKVALLLYAELLFSQRTTWVIRIAYPSNSRYIIIIIRRALIFVRLLHNVHYLGHANIQNTVRYTQLSSARFEGLWDWEEKCISAKACPVSFSSYPAPGDSFATFTPIDNCSNRRIPQIFVSLPIDPIYSSFYKTLRRDKFCAYCVFTPIWGKGSERVTKCH